MSTTPERQPRELLGRICAITIGHYVNELEALAWSNAALQAFELAARRLDALPAVVPQLAPGA